MKKDVLIITAISFVARSSASGPLRSKELPTTAGELVAEPFLFLPPLFVEATIQPAASISTSSSGSSSGLNPISQQTMTSSISATATVAAFNALSLSSPLYSNVTLAFRFENTQNEYFAARKFCKAQGEGVHCYVPAGCENKCIPSAMISCPEQVIIKCREGFMCYQPDPQYAAQCRAVIDGLQQGIWNYGSPRIVSAQGGKLGFEITTSANSVATFVPKICKGPHPRPLEECLHPKNRTVYSGSSSISSGGSSNSSIPSSVPATAAVVLPVTLTAPPSASYNTSSPSCETN